ncbi:response regulator transcription factor [Raoultibacter phocaeensis]|uniref:response regulator transcription factor n=1 Tax=Raoultibacter phocaeensis TaxID=2479841 RepID=UPI00111B6A15|nr:helix-turn-helix transcriptional regulator [Raoultibacter phocaeensis]
MSNDSESVYDGKAIPDGRLILAAIGFGCFLAVQTYCGLSIALPLASGYGESYAVVLRIVAILAMLGVYVLGYTQADWLVLHYSAVLMPAVAIGVVPFLAEAAALCFGVTLGLAAVLTWALLGISFAASGLLWCLILSHNSMRQNILTVATSAFFSVLLYVFSCAVQPPQLGLMGMSIIIAAEVAICRLLMKNVDWGNYLREEDESVFRETSKKAFWLACHSAAYGIILIVTVSLGLGPALIVGACGVIGAALSIMAKHWSLNRVLKSQQVQQMSLPFIVAILFLIPYCNEAALIVCAGLTVAFNAFAMVLAWCERSELNQEFRIHSIRRYSKASIPNWIGLLVGTVVGWYIFMRNESTEQHTHFILIGLSFLLLLSFVLLNSEESRKAEVLNGGFGEVDPDERDISSDHDGRFIRACKRVILDYGLSPREAEVFLLLAKGRNVERIEEKLVISNSTARTHVYNIYKKLGVGSHQALIDMVEAEKIATF